MILSFEDMEKLGMTISGLPSPTDLDNNAQEMDYELLSDPVAKDLDRIDYAKVQQACGVELSENQVIQISEWCTLEGAEVTFEVNQEK